LGRSSGAWQLIQQGKGQKTLSQNSSQPISSINNAIQTTYIDILLNQLDIAESDLTQALNDTPIDVMSDE